MRTSMRGSIAVLTQKELFPSSKSISFSVFPSFHNLPTEAHFLSEGTAMLPLMEVLIELLILQSIS